MSATLTSLRIRNLALVEDLTWEPGAGFTAITGETGAGKSVILGALTLLLGERADKGLIRTGADACAVEAVFENVADRRLAGSLLEKTIGWKPVFASGGAEALTVLEREHPSVVLTDLLMPGTDALHLIEQIRAQYPFVPIVLMIGHGNEGLALRALQKGAASYIPKKSLAADLAITLDQVLAAARFDRPEKRGGVRPRVHHDIQDCSACCHPAARSIQGSTAKGLVWFIGQE